MRTGELAIVIFAIGTCVIVVSGGSVQNIQGPVPRDTARSAESAILQGQVAAPSGQPLVRAVVRLFPTDASLKIRLARADKSGRFEFRDVASGHYRLAAEKAGFVPLYFGQRQPFETGRVIDVQSGQRLANLNMVLPRAGAIEGVVVDEFGEPVADAVVVAARNEYLAGARRLTTASARPARTNDKGEFRLYGLSPSSYYVFSYLDASSGPKVESEVTYGRSYYPGTSSVAEAERIWVRLGEEVKNLKLSLSPARTTHIRGVVLDANGAPLSNGTVMLSQSSFGPSRSLGVQSNMIRTKSDGTFEFGDVAPGEYSLSCRTMADGTMESASQTVSVLGDGDLDEIVVALSRGIDISGAVIADTGALLPFQPSVLSVGAVPIPFDTGAAAAPATVTDDFRFQLRGLNGRALIRVSGLPTGWFLKQVLRGQQDVSDAGVVPSEATQTDGLTIVLTQSHSELTGSVMAAGKTVANYAVVVFSDDSSKWMFPSRHIASAHPDESGTFRIVGLPPGRYNAIAFEYLQQGEADDPEFLERAAQRATQITVREGESKNLELTLTLDRP